LISVVFSVIPQKATLPDELSSLLTGLYEPVGLAWLFGCVGYAVLRRLKNTRLKNAKKSAGARLGDTKNLSEEDAHDLIGEYGSVLLKLASSPNIIHDESLLPAPKAQIKEAIMLALSVARDAQSREYLAGGYLELARFQPGIEDAATGLDFDSVPTDDPMEAAKRVAQSEGLKRMIQLGPSVEREMAVLLAELKAQGY
jgi:hypothetical protein